MDCPNCQFVYGTEVEMVKEDMSGIGTVRKKEVTFLRVEYACPACGKEYVWEGRGKGLKVKP